MGKVSRENIRNYYTFDKKVNRMDDIILYKFPDGSVDCMIEIVIIIYPMKKEGMNSI